MASEGPPLKKARHGAGSSVVLGTSSKWRRALFQQHFPEIGAELMKPDIDEKAIRKSRPEDMTVAIAEAKADALISRLDGREVLLLTMDQVVCCGEQVREKPDDEDQAREFLDSYRNGQSARCVNGLVVHNLQTGKRITGVECASVSWKNFPDSVVDHLISKGDVFTCAGGFVLEDEELSKYVNKVGGTAGTIEGLPVQKLREMMRLAVAPGVTHVLFDMDGLLLDTESAYTVAQQEIVGRWGKTFTWALKAKMMGRKALGAAQLCIEELELQDKISAQDFVTERERILDVLFVKAALMPGVERLVRHLHAKGIPMAVATSSHKRHFDLKTGLHKELFALMHHIVTGDQVKKSKPDPEIFLLAASLFEGGGPSDMSTVLVFEDAPNGVEAGLAAGMQVCHVPDSNLSHELRGDSHCEVSSLEEFRPEQFGLPSFD